ncbi:MAG TPA: hypothetical protein VJ762_14640 [Sphingobium sp.]|nr:hypothetical protein [Sphingobium sp.]
MEDLNFLLQREQEELLRSQSAPCAAARAAHHGLAQGYARRIRDHRLPYRSKKADGSMLFNPFPFGTWGNQA